MTGDLETGDAVTGAEGHAADTGLVVMGSTGRGLVPRVVIGSLTLDVIEDVRRHW